MQKKTILKTVAFQFYDNEQDTLAEYEKRQKESGMSVKDYHVNLIKADISQNQTQKDEIEETIHQDQSADVSPQQAEETVEQTHEETVEQIHEETVEQTPEEAVEQAEECDIDVAEQEIDTPSEEVASDYSPSAEPSAPVEMMNLFVKITSEQREALDYQKTETGEAVGTIINRLVGNFLEDLRNDNLSEEFEETYQYYSENAANCNKTVSAKIPVSNNQELADYLSEQGGSRNALMSSLVHMELYGQEQEQSQTMSM